MSTSFADARTAIGLWIIIFFGGLGALIYIAAEVIPDAGLMRQSFKVFPRRRRIHELESAILDNPSAGNYEELADLYLEEGNYARARQCYDKAISSRTDSLDPFYRRGMAATSWVTSPRPYPILNASSRRIPSTTFSAPPRLLAHAYANTGQPEQSRGSVSRGHENLHFVRDVLQLRLLPGRSATQRRGPRMGAAHSGQEADHAGISASPRATLVPQKASALLNRLH